jgi:hypothetical protein
VKRVGDRRVVIDGGTYLVRELVELAERSSAEAPAPYLRAQKVGDISPERVPDLQSPMVYQPNWAYSRLLLPSMRRGRLHEILFGGEGAGFHVLHYDKDLFTHLPAVRRERVLCVRTGSDAQALSKGVSAQPIAD